MKWCFSRDPPLPCIAAPLKPTSPLLIILICLALIAALPAAAHAQEQPPPPPPPPPPLKVEAPDGKPLIREGQAGRELLGGTWYFRQDDTLTQGDTERWYEQDDLTGWTPITVPHNWNATDTQLNLATVGWYRKEFKLPEAPKDVLRFWKVRFEGSNYRTKVWLNGRHIGGFTGLFPFEAELKGLRKGRNTLVVKVSTLRSRTDLTHWRPASFNGYGTGGWWNFGGLLREVYVRRVDTVDIQDVNVLPRLRRVRGPAKVEVRTTLRNFTRKERDVTLVLDVAGEHITLEPETLPPLAERELTTEFTITRPRLWQPGRPFLYKLSVGAVTEGERRATYRLDFGVRKLETRGSAMLLNGHKLNVRGASIHEDDLNEGGALSTATRSHYPLHPAFIEAFDRLGILYWVDAPVYQLPNSYFDLPGVRTSATRAAVLTVRNNINHPSIFTWSLANEPGGSRAERGVIGAGLATYIRDASAAVRELDDTRFVAIDRQSRVGEPLTSSAYRYLDELGPYLDQVHAANPSLPLMITEFGAEAKGPGPVEQPGTYEFQDKFLQDHLAVHASKPYINGSIYWALRDFRVHPTWEGGAPVGWSQPPWNNKSLIEETNQPKPAFTDVRRLWRRVRPL